MFSRPSWDEYFIKIAELTSKRSNCIKRQVGCIIVKDNHILSLGYNGTPQNTLNCFEGGCLRCSNKNLKPGNHLDLCMCIHAEENALLYVSKNELENSILYVTLSPCIGCVKKILQCKIKKVVFINAYSNDLDEISHKILLENNIELFKYNASNNLFEKIIFQI
jgi:dCMP deaminase